MMTRLLFAAAGACLALSATKSGAAPRYNKSEVQVQASKTDRTRAPVKAKKAALPRRPKLVASQFRATARTKMARLTDDAIRKLEQLLKLMPKNDPEKPGVLFRLAEHFREKKVRNEFRARELDEKIYMASGPARKIRLRKAQKRYETASHKWMVQAISKYLEIYGEPAYRKFKRTDEVLFNLAAMLNEVKRRDKAREVFSRLIRDFPNSRYVPDAVLSFAEYYFNQGKVEDALRLYQRVGKYPGSAIYGYAVYKQGWCWLNLKDPRRALELFVKVIRNANSWTGSKRGKIVLVKEARKDAVRAYSYVGTPNKAWRFFSRIGGGAAKKMLERLASMYYDQGKFSASARLYKRLISLAPKSRSLCTWQYAVVKATLPSKVRRNIVVEAKRLAAVYRLVKRRKIVRSAALQRCRADAAAVLRELATTWHREAQKTMDQNTYALAEYLYKEYLDVFSKQKDAYTLRFYYGELLYKLEKWEKAALAYGKVIKMKPGGKYHKDASWARVIALKNASNAEEARAPIQRDSNDTLAPRPIPPKKQKMLAAIDTYLRVVPRAKERVPLLYRKARIYYEYNHFDKAVEVFAQIATKHPDHELAIYSANLLLDSFNILKRYDAVERWVDRFLREPKLAKGEFPPMLRKLKVNIQWQKAEKLRKAHRYRECGEQLARMANKYPDDKRWSELVYNGALCFEAAKLIGMAISLRSTLVKVKPNDPLAQKSLYMIGANYHALAWYSRAADSYETFAKRFPGEPEAPKALQNAIVFRLGRAEYDKAIDNAELFAKQYGRRARYASRTAAVMFSLGQIYEQKKDRDAVVKHYTKYLRSWAAKGGIDRKILAHVRIGEALWKASCPAKTVHGACISIQRERSKRRLKRRQPKKLRDQCGPQTKSRISVIKRHGAKARAAMKHFDKALALFKRASRVKGTSKQERARRVQEMRFAVASALFHRGEKAYEDFLAVALPTGLRFSSNRQRVRSDAILKKYLERKGGGLMRTRAVYQDVIKLKVAHWAIAGAARIGQLYQSFADALYTAPLPKVPIPKVLRTRAQREEFRRQFIVKYCDTFVDRAAPIERRAVEALAICVKKSTDLSWYNAWSGLCEKELNQIRPDSYPLATEIRAKPRYVNVAVDRAGLIAKLK